MPKFLTADTGVSSWSRKGTLMSALTEKPPCPEKNEFGFTWIFQ